jgi:hypothetical protein
MIILTLAAFQLAAGAPHVMPPKDSAKLLAHVRDAELSYIMDWRHEWEMWRVDLARVRQSLEDQLMELPEQPTVLRPAGGVNGEEVIRYDIDQHEAMAHFIRAPNPRYSLVPQWVSPADTEPADEALGIDNPLTLEYQDTVRSRRMPLLAALDTASRALPGDGWLAGQRVRMHLDQKEIALALRATAECRAAQWWCLALRGYVRFTAHDAAGAAATFDTALTRMPPETRCQWNDVSELLVYTARTAYAKLSCAQQDSVNGRLWWLADPLYLVPTNDRRTEHYARRVLIELDAGNDVDEREDMRADYTGPAEREMVLRYGWPTTMTWIPPRKCAPHTLPPLCYYVVPPGLSRFDTRSTYLGVTGLSNERRPANPRYWGPQYHTIPAWSAINDPLHAKTGDWDLGPNRQDALIWDSSWWATEFYQRYEGPLVGLTTQIAFVRRATSAAIVAATQWGIDPAILAPPAQAAVGVITSGGPNEKPHIVGVKMDGAHPRAILTPVESRPLLLGVEMVPQNDSGPAGRTRFGIAPPPPLSALKPGQLAISDPILARADSGELAPTSVQQTLPRMYGSTRLQNPNRVAIFWEVYGQNDGDTVDVALRVVRESAGGLLSRAGSLVGIGSAGSDSEVVKWREPRPGDPLAVTEGGVTIRPRGIVLDLSGLEPGDYAVEVHVDRRDVTAVSSRREFSIVRQ